MKLVEAMYGWNRNSGEIGVGPWPDTTGGSDRYSLSGGACYTNIRQMSPDQQVAQIFIDFHTLVIRDDTFSPQGSPPGTTFLSWSGSSARANAVAVAPGGRAYVAGSSDVTGLPRQFGVIAIVAAPNQAPVVDRSSFEFETAHRMRFQFNEAINPATLAAADLTLSNVGTGLPVDATGATVAYDAATRTARSRAAAPDR